MDDAQLPKEYSPYYVAICISKVQQDISYIKEQLSTIVPDHENRLRILEKTKEECKQLDILDDINDRLNEHDDKLGDLDKTITTHLTEASTESRFTSRRRELLLLVFGIILGAIVSAIATEIIGNAL